YADVPQPTPGPGQALVKIDAAGVNYVDVYQRTGLYPVKPPLILGQAAGGTVAAVGPGVSEVEVGHRVAYAHVLGAYAEYAAVPAERLVVLPNGVGTQQGAAAMLQGVQAHRRMMVLYGQSGARVGPFAPLVLSRNGSLFLTRPTLAHYLATRDELVARAEEVIDWVPQGKLALRIGHEFPLAEASEAHRQLEARQTTGKVLLIP